MSKTFLTPQTIQKPDFEDAATNYFQDEPGCKAGIQLQKDAWDAAIDAVMLFINDRNMVQVDELKGFKFNPNYDSQKPVEWNNDQFLKAHGIE